ncbi:unnamed protein product, partial [Allacma fusca]
VIRSSVQMESAKEKDLKRQLNKFESIDIVHVANIFHANNGADPRKLFHGYKEKDGVYGQAAQILFQENTVFLRMQLFTIWQANKKQIRETYLQLCGELEKSFDRKNVLKVQEVDTAYCWCGNRGFADKHFKPPPSVQCDYCDNWYHCICAGISLKAAKSLEKYKCLVCRNEMKLPALLDFTPVGKSKLGIATEMMVNVQRTLKYSSESTSSEGSGTSEHTDADDRGQSKSPSVKALSCGSSGSSTTSETVQKEPPIRQSKSVDEKKDVVEKETSNKNVDENPKTKDERKLMDYECSTPFTIKISAEDMKKVLRYDYLPNSKKRYEVMSKTYGNVLQRCFSEQNKLCTLGMGKTVILHPEDHLMGTFLKCYTYCNAKHCTAKYGFYMDNPPKPDASSHTFLVKQTSGQVKHFKGETNMRQLRGPQRQEIQKELEMQNPSKVHRKLYETADPEMLKLGNRDTVKNLRVLQQAKYEKRKEDDYADDVVTDVLLTYFVQQREEKGKTLDGYIQYVSDIPFFVVMYTEKQLKYLHSVSKKNDVVLFFDGTSLLAQKLPHPYEDKEIFYYALVLKPEKGVPEMPIMEFYTSRQDVPTLENILRWFLNDYKKVCNIKGRNYKIARIEVDFSKAILAAVINVFHSIDTETYLNQMWNACVMDKFLQRPFVLIHVCRIHVLRFWRRRLIKVFSGAQRSAHVRSFWTTWIYGFINSKNSRSMCRRIADILIITGNTYWTPEVQERVQSIGVPSLNFKDPLDAISVNLDEIDVNGSFSRKSPFGFYSYLVAESVKRKENSVRVKIQNGESNYENNDYASSVLFDYVLRTLLPYTPFINQTGFEILDLPVIDDNTNTVEYFIKILKKDHFAGATHQKVSRLVRSQLHLVKGQLNRVYEATGSFPHADSDKPQPPYGDCPNESADDSDIGISLSDIERDEGKESEGGRTKFDDGVKSVKTHTKRASQATSQRKDRSPETKKDNCQTRNGEENRAQLLWVLRVLRLPVQECLDMLETERDNGTKPLKPLFRVIEQHSRCQNLDCPDSAQTKLKLISLAEIIARDPGDLRQQLQNGSVKPSACKICQRGCAITYRLANANAPPPILVYTCNSLHQSFDAGNATWSNYSQESLLALDQTIMGNAYKVASYTVHTGNHYFAVLIFNGKKYVYDGMRKKLENRENYNCPGERAISSVWLALDELRV